MNNEPTPEQIRERNEWLAQALEQNPKKATRLMRDSKGGRCCLCVARDVAKEHGLELPEQEPVAVPEAEVAQWFGWRNTCRDAAQNPSLTHPDTKATLEASRWNDGPCGETPPLPHTEIAELFRYNYCNDPSNPATL